MECYKVKWIETISRECSCYVWSENETSAARDTAKVNRTITDVIPLTREIEENQNDSKTM